MIIKKLRNILIFFCYFFAQTISFANSNTKVLSEVIDQNKTQTIEVEKIHFVNDKQLEIHLSNKGEFKSFILENPNRLVIDVRNAKLSEEIKPILPINFSQFRSRKDQEKLRIVFDLTTKIAIDSTSFEKIKNKNPKIVIKFSVNNLAKNSTKKENLSENSLEKKEKTELTKTAIPIIVIDAGHGGKDPGTIGNYARSREKNITLAYAKELKKYLKNTKKYKVFLTRDDDYFIPLRKRVEKARKIKADLFISMHANAAADNLVSGFSIYTLSEKSSDKQAELLAQKENRSDIIAGMDFGDTSQDIVKTLIDMSQRDSKNNSVRFASLVIKSVKNSGIEILQNTHRFAGFAVLTAPDMASVLIELGYLSNKQEESKLNSLGYKRKLMESLVDAIEQYFK
jgi:N-acetylmuramoyl-L-alanine amidase